MKQGTGLIFLRHLWENRAQKPDIGWETINHAMRDALRIAVVTRLGFSPSDLQYIEDNMRTGYWLGEHGWEPVYAEAIEHDNRQFIESFEQWIDRPPFFANNILFSRYGGDSHYKHGSNGRQRCRLAEGFCIGGSLMRVTTMAKDHVIVCEYKQVKNGKYYTDKLVKRNKWTRDDLARLYPAPRKTKPNDLTNNQ